MKLALQYSVKVVGQRPGHPGKALLEDSMERGEGRRRGWSFVNSVWRGEEGLDGSGTSGGVAEGAALAPAYARGRFCTAGAGERKG